MAKDIKDRGARDAAVRRFVARQWARGNLTHSSDRVKRLARTVKLANDILQVDAQRRIDAIVAHNRKAHGVAA